MKTELQEIVNVEEEHDCEEVPKYYQYKIVVIQMKLKMMKKMKLVLILMMNSQNYLMNKRNLVKRNQKKKKKVDFQSPAVHLFL
jgi:hypothetical protein